MRSGKVPVQQNFFASILFILFSPAILRSRILRHKASALRLGQFSNFWEKLLKNLYSLMVTDMRRCILANVGSAVLALSTFLTVLKKKMSRRGFFCNVFSFSLAVKIVDLHAACCHCTTLHFANTTTLRCTALQNTATDLSRWRRRVVVYRYCCRPHSTRLVSTRLVHCVCVHRARRL